MHLLLLHLLLLIFLINWPSNELNICNTDMWISERIWQLLTKVTNYILLLYSWLLRRLIKHWRLLNTLLLLLVKEYSLRLFARLLVDKHFVSDYVLLSLHQLLLRWFNWTPNYLGWVLLWLSILTWNNESLILETWVLLWRHLLNLASISERVIANLFWICVHNSVNLLWHISWIHWM